MAFASVTYQFVNSTTASATDVNTNFSDIIDATSDGTIDFNISALTCAGAVIFNGHITLGSGSADDLTVNASLASTIPIKVTRTYNIGSADLGLATIYLGGNSTHTVALSAPGSGMSGDVTFTLPSTNGSAGQALITNGSGALSYAPLQTDINAVSSADYVVLDTDGYGLILLTAGGTDRTITLPTAADNTDRVLDIVKVDGLDSDGTGKLTIDGEGAETIGGAATQLLFSAGDNIKIKCDGTTWHILKLRQIEYLYNTTVTDADNTANPGYGPVGSQFADFTSGRIKRVVPLAAIIASDDIRWQMSQDTGATWHDLGSIGDNIEPFHRQNATEYGVLLAPVTTTAISVSFAAYRRSTGATFGASGTDYGAIDNNAAFTWRVKKSRTI